MIIASVIFWVLRRLFEAVVLRRRSGAGEAAPGRVTAFAGVHEYEIAA